MPQQFYFKMCQVCINCGGWIYPRGETAICGNCQFDNEKFAEFFIFCNYLENELGKAYSSRFYAARTQERNFGLNFGWLPDILAIMSAITLGVLTNASDEAVKRWTLSKKEEYKRWYIEPFKYETSVDILFDYISENRDKITSFRIPDDRLNSEFENHLTRLRNQIQSLPSMEI
jgi:hypothetical protein